MKKTILVFSIFIINIFAQDINIATFGNEKITDFEFKKRFETTIHYSNNYQPGDTSRFQFLYTLITQKLWAMEARNKGYVLEDSFQKQLKIIEKNLVKDALYRSEIWDKIQISPKEKNDGYKKISKDITCFAISSPDSTFMSSLYMKLSTGFPFENVLEFEEFKNCKESQKITFGTLTDENLENLIYSLKEKEYTKPIKLNNIWIIYKVDKILTQALGISEGQQAKVIKTIKERKSKILLEKYLKTKINKFSLSVNNSLLKKLTEELFKAYSQIEKKGKDKFEETHYFIYKARNKFTNDSLKMPIFKTNSNTEMSLDDFIAYSYNEGIQVKENTKKFVYEKLKSFIKNASETEIFYNEGKKQGLDRSPVVQEALKIWQDYYLSKGFQTKELDTVKATATEVSSYYNRRYEQGRRIKVMGIETDFLDNIQNFINNVAKNNYLIENSKTIGNTTYFNKYITKTDYPEITDKLEKAKIGDSFGPFKRSNLYVFIKIMDIVDTIQYKPLDEVRKDIETSIKLNKGSHIFDKMTSDLARKYNLNVNEKELMKLELTSAPMMTYQMLGFGGRMLTAPIIFPANDWVKIWKEQKVNP